MLKSLNFLSDRIQYPIGIFCKDLLKPFSSEYRRYKKFLDFLEKSQWRSKEELKQYQKERLKALLFHAYEFFPYYKEIFKKWKYPGVDITPTKVGLKVSVA